MKVYCFLFLLLFVSDLQTQVVDYPLTVGDRWRYGFINPGHSTYMVEFQVAFDTIMSNGYQYAVHVQTLDGSNHVWYPTYERQEGNQVFRYNPPDEQEYLMYDFSRAVGDTVGFYVADFDTFDVVLKSYNEATFWGGQRRTWSFGHVVRNLTDGSKSTTIVDSLGVYQYSLDTEPYYFGGAVISGKTYGTIPAVARRGNEVPQEPYLYQNFPNPFNGTTSIRYSLPRSAGVNLEVFDLLGRKIATLVHRRENSGSHALTLDSPFLASGFYLLRLTVGNTSQSRLIVLLK